MKLNHRREKNICIISIEGRMIQNDVSSVREYILSTLEDEPIAGLVLNLDKVHHVDSAGIGMFIFVRARVDQRNAKLALCHLNEHLFKVFKMTGLTSHISIFKTEKEAIAALI